MTLAMMVMMFLAPLSPKLQTALDWVLDELGPKQKHFSNPPGKNFSEQLRKVEKVKPFGQSRAKKKDKKMPHFDHFPCPLGKLTHIYIAHITIADFPAVFF